MTTADASSIIATCCRDGATADGDRAARCPIGTTDAGTICATRSGDGAALNHDVAAINVISAADTGTIVIATGVE